MQNITKDHRGGRAGGDDLTRAAADDLRLVVFSDDWGRHPSSCQHLVRALLPRYRTVWINTIGTRRPGLSRYALRRALEKIWGWAVAAVRGASGNGGELSNPRIVDPLMWPSFGSMAARRLNRRVLARAVAKGLGGSAPAVAVTTLPIVADLVGAIPLRRWVYYCVDDLSDWPGLDRGPLERMERLLVRRADAVIAASRELVARMDALGRRATLLTHGVDLEHWAGSPAAEVEAVTELPTPRIVFWGVVDRRLDVEALARLVERLGGGSVILVGPENDPDRRLSSLPRLFRIGPVSYQRLPAVAHSAAVLIMPYADLPATRSMQPLKLKEYLATGKPLVARRLPALDEWADACDLYDTPGGFAELVQLRLHEGTPTAQQAARRRLAGESWSRKAEIFERLVLGEWR